MTHSTLSATLLVQRIGPYHHARFQAAACCGRGLTVIEFRTTDRVYAWDEVRGGTTYVRARAATLSQIIEELERSRPDVLVCVGYADHEIHHAMRWAIQKGVPMVVCSDSTADDEPRVWWKERFKRELVSLFSAGLVAGARSADYLVGLGFVRDSLFTAWDVVDNEYFATETQRIRQTKAPVQPYFLTVARFVPKKNIAGLLRAYASYVVTAGDSAWPMVLSGDGELRPQLVAQIEAAGLTNRVRLTGFVQYDQLPELYAGAGALILPSLSDQWGLVVNEAMAAGLPVLVSNRCGCATDLVSEEGELGFVFDPHDENGLAMLMERFAGMSVKERARIGCRSRERVEEFSVKTFAKGLWSAVEHAQKRPRCAARWSRILLAVLDRARRER